MMADLKVVAYEVTIQDDDGNSAVILTHGRVFESSQREPLVLLKDVFAAVEAARNEPDPKQALEYLVTLCSCAYEES